MDTSLLLDSGKYSDLRIVSREESWNVHRNVLSTASSVFERMIDELPANVHPGVIDLTKYEPKIVEKMLRFIYQGDYDDGHKTDHPKPNLQTKAGQTPGLDTIGRQPQEHARPFQNGEALIVNIKVFIIADHYNMKTLMECAAKKYQETAQELWNTPSFVSSMKLFYGSNIYQCYRQPICRVIISVIAKNAAVLLKDESLRHILHRHGDLATEVLSAVVKVEDE